MQVLERIVERRPEPELERRLLAAGAGSLAARVAASRLAPDVDVARFLRASVADLDSPDTLPDVDVAAARILSALSRKEVIALCCDHDADGCSSAAVLASALMRMGHPGDRIAFVISHRLKEGYGLSDAVAARMMDMAPRPTLVITADCGSSDGARIAGLAAAGIDTVVTDHHQLTAAAFPDKAVAVVSPARLDCAYPDRNICGAMVAWLLMCRTRNVGVASGQFATSVEKFRDLLGFVAIATVADCVSIASINNRAVVREGIRQINAGLKPWARQARDRLGGEEAKVDEETVAFQIAPRLAAHGRLDDAMPGVHFLLADTDSEAERWFGVLNEANESRKQIEREITAAGLKLAKQLVEEGRVGLAIFLSSGMSGVHGISSSRVTECYGLPSAMMTPTSSDAALTTISARSIEGCNLKQVLDDMASVAPALFLSYGGHAAAAGAKIRTADRARFEELFDRMVRRQIGDREPSRTFRSDGALAQGEATLETVRELSQLGPFGRGFEQPNFAGTFTAKLPRRVGDDRRHVSLELAAGAASMKSIWFGAIAEVDGPLPVRDGEKVRALVRLGRSVWRGQPRLEVFVQHCVPEVTA